jgi:hypothetical protein
MKCLKYFLFTVLIAKSFCNDFSQGEMNECLAKTLEAFKCCPISISKFDMFEDEDCKHHFEGFAEMSDDDKHQAIVCLENCFYEKNSWIVDKEFNMEKIKAFAEEFLDDQPEFKDVYHESIEHCSKMSRFINMSLKNV